MDTNALIARAQTEAKAWVNSPYYAAAEGQMHVFWGRNSRFLDLFQRLDLARVLELACGHGRHGEHVLKYYLPEVGQMVCMDVVPTNVAFTRDRLERWRKAKKMHFVRNNGIDFRPVKDGALTAIFCFDAMVHFHRDVVAAYLRDTARALLPGGQAVFHHSNLGINPDTPAERNPGARGYMTRELFAKLAQDAGLEIVEQSVVSWGTVADLDCISLVRKPAGKAAARAIDTRPWMESRPWIDLPDAPIESYVAGLASRPAFDLAAKLREWSDRGVVIFEKAVDPAMIDAFDKDLEYLKNHYRDYTLGVELKATTRDIKEYTREDLDSQGIKFNHMHTISRAAVLLSLSESVVQFLAHVFRSPPCVLQSLTFHRGSQQPAHIDYPYVRTQTKLAHLAASWIPLEDIHPDSGPLAYFPGSHKPEISGFFDWGGGSILMERNSTNTPVQFGHFLDERMRSQGVKPEVFCPKKGDVLIWHGNLVHEGTAIRQQDLTRKSYVTHYTSLEAYPPGHLEPKALDTGAFVAAHGGYAFDLPWLRRVPRLPGWKK